ncbi:MAG TPA: bifunctional tRNA (5-methylaminomethyl-2-thiouridine)(34)-methyltransferase MnmD/FAD-dependent 5-carboxymethylaminomethyl-2-thiouridine(34) oxidoreductase MnmC [Cellvibrio sp.]|nr:bifunctional tRNA (5-methylaminomethyl-2-thiouridine)(34)-methyltransferase MnmD/FAD-dependent 5-carboxymethylaminomethyl-2-thiouridine(34) oxidoreductase MnmC [Cellvibrio sp.]
MSQSSDSKIKNAVEPTKSSTITHAQLQWDAQGQPLSSTFGDIYFSTTDGLEETRHVFLHHNQLASRWAQLSPGKHFCIAETGFGSGLNFLAAWDLWLATAPADAQLHFVSVEKYPLNKTDLERALALWPTLTGLSAELIASYPCIVGNGFHRLNFHEGRIKLTLIIDDASSGFGKLLASPHPLFASAGAKVDAWFLDGFAPAKNPQMWSQQLFEVLGKLSKPGTTAATFSAAALVKQGLRQAGFSIEKVAGYGRKREMVKALLTTESEPPNAEDYSFRGSFSPYPQPWTVQQPHPVSANRRAIVIGGGLAGCHSARALAERGWQVTLMERGEQLAQGGSGNPQGALYAKLSPLNEAQAAFNLACLQYALQHYRKLWPEIGSQCGLLQLAYNPAEQDLHQQLRERFATAETLVEFVTAERASEIASVDIASSGLYFPEAGWIDPRKLCTLLADHPLIHRVMHTEITELQPLTDNHGNTDWRVIASNGTSSTASVVVIASATEALRFPQSSHLPIKAIRGQVTYLPQTPSSPPLKTVVCAEGYISPAAEGIFCTGATFNLNDSDSELRSSDHITNLSRLRQHLPGVAKAWERTDIHSLAGRVGFRCTLPDYLPALGPLPAVEQLLQDFSPLRKNARAGITCPGSYIPGLYINIGHGARGLAYTPFCAELLAAQINRETLPLATELANALNPARFIIRDLIKGKR